MSDFLKNLSSAISNDQQIAESYLSKNNPSDLKELNDFTLDIQKRLKSEDLSVFISEFRKQKKRFFKKIPKIDNPVSVLLEELRSTDLQPSFRNLSKINAADAERILQYSDLLLSINEGTISIDSRLTGSTPADTSSKILSYYNITESQEIDLDGIISDIGIFLDEDEMSSSEGRLIINNNRAVISVNSNVNENGRKRFIQAHELAHFMLHRNKRNYFLCTSKDFNDWFTRRNIEAEANQFAANLLMPKQNFTKEFSIEFTLNEVLRVKEIFGTTFTSTIRRYIEIGSQPIAMIMFKKGSTKKPWYNCSKDFPYSEFETNTPPENSLSKRAFNFSDNISLGTIAEQSAENWFPYHFEGYPKKLLYEQCIQMPNYNTVLTVLWS